MCGGRLTKGSPRSDLLRILGISSPVAYSSICLQAFDLEVIIMRPTGSLTCYTEMRAVKHCILRNLPNQP